MLLSQEFGQACLTEYWKNDAKWLPFGGSRLDVYFGVGLIIMWLIKKKYQSKCF